MPSSPSGVVAPPASTKPTAGRKQRPTFRPASQRKSPKKKSGAKDPSRVAITEGGAPNDDTSADPNMHASSGPTASGGSRTTAPQIVKRTKRRSKVSKGVSIGLRRTDEEASEAPLGLATTEASYGVTSHSLATQVSAPASATPSVLVTGAVGRRALSSFCSSYRIKIPMEKRAGAKTNTASAPAAPISADHKSATTSTAAATSAAASAGPVVQVVNGEIVLQESSMVIPGVRRSVEQVEEEFEQVVEEEGHSAAVGASYNSFVSRRAPQHWSVEETKKFFHSLRQIGPDFGTMEALFENRTRKQLKRKYQSENNKNPRLIELALNPKSQVPLDITAFKVEVGGARNGSASATKNKVILNDEQQTDSRTKVDVTTEQEQVPPAPRTGEQRTLLSNDGMVGFDTPAAVDSEDVLFNPPPRPCYDDAIASRGVAAGDAASTFIPKQSTKILTAAKRPKFKATRSSKRNK